MFGAPKKCAKCDKQVYSIEELKCLDKVWHKGCFKCSVCNTTLNLKNYKGVDKLPYCSVHYPKQTHTAVIDNPELLRIKENTKIQSNAKYHEDYEKSKGNFTVVADNPEMRRVLENTKNISNIKYHEDFEKSRHTSNRLFANSPGPDVVQVPMSNSTIIASYRSGEDQFIEPTIKSQQRHIGSISEYDPENNNNSFNKQYQAMQDQLNKQKQMLQQQQQKQQQYSNVNNISSQVLTSVFRAIYDYDAKEDDEISFRDGDKFINCEQIDVGWMIGVHERTGKHGMIPFNYAEPIDLF